MKDPYGAVALKLQTKKKKKAVRPAAPKTEVLPKKEPPAARTPEKKKSDAKNRRSGTVPYRVEPDGTVRVMLVTPIGGGKWMLPKGNIEKRMTSHESAAKEAMEEAGVIGICDPVVIGSYRFRQEQTVEIYPLRITQILEQWMEHGKRSRFLFRLDKAELVVDSADMRSVLQNLKTYLETRNGGV